MNFTFQRRERQVLVLRVFMNGTYIIIEKQNILFDKIIEAD